MIVDLKANEWTKITATDLTFAQCDVAVYFTFNKDEEGAVEVQAGEMIKADKDFYVKALVNAKLRVTA